MKLPTTDLGITVSGKCDSILKAQRNSRRCLPEGKQSNKNEEIIDLYELIISHIHGL